MTLVKVKRKPFECCSKCHMTGGGDFGRCGCTDGGYVLVPEYQAKTRELLVQSEETNDSKGRL